MELFSNIYAKYLLQVTADGSISFQQHSQVKNSSSEIPLIAMQWPVDPPGTTLFARVAEDSATLELVREILTEQNPAMSDFLPSLAVVMTWHNNSTIVGIKTQYSIASVQYLI